MVTPKRKRGRPRKGAGRPFTWSQEQIDACCRRACEIGASKAAREHGIPLNTLAYHRDRGGWKFPEMRGGPRSYGKLTEQIDLAVEVLAVLARREGWPPLHLEEIAAVCGCSRERISQVEKKALRKLRARLGGDLGEELRQFLKRNPGERAAAGSCALFTTGGGKRCQTGF